MAKIINLVHDLESCVREIQALQGSKPTKFAVGTQVECSCGKQYQLDYDGSWVEIPKPPVNDYDG